MSRTITEADRAEQCGCELAESVLTAICNASDQSVGVVAMETALLELRRLPHPKRAAGGFAMGLIAYLEKGLEVEK